jgi:hypothetical protein
MDEAYALAAAGDSAAVPSVKVINEAMKGRKGVILQQTDKGWKFVGAELETHHTVPKYLQRMLDISEDALDDCPGLLTTMEEHRGVGGIHSIMSQHLPPLGSGARYSVGEIFAGLEASYTEAGLADVWSVARNYLTSRGIAP